MTRKQLHEAMAALPESDRELLDLRYWKGMSAAECARRVGRPASTIRTQLQRAVGRLRDEFYAGLAPIANLWAERLRRDERYPASLVDYLKLCHTAGQTKWVTKTPYPYAELVDEIRETDAKRLLALAEEAIKANDQARACAVVHRYGELKLPARPVFDLLLKYAVSEDGALHAEKYYRTVSEEYTTIRPAFRWRQLVALARVTASEFGFPAPGHKEACELLHLS